MFWDLKNQGWCCDCQARKQHSMLGFAQPEKVNVGKSSIRSWQFQGKHTLPHKGQP
jgi:hypothetical protein